MNRQIHILLFTCILFLVTACDRPGSGPAAQTISPDDLLGTWQADYSQYEVFDSYTFGFVSGIEQLSFTADGSFSQYFDDELVAQGKWDLDSSNYYIFMAPEYSFLVEKLHFNSLRVMRGRLRLIVMAMILL